MTYGDWRTECASEYVRGEYVILSHIFYYFCYWTRSALVVIIPATTAATISTNTVFTNAIYILLVLFCIFFILIVGKTVGVKL